MSREGKLAQNTLILSIGTFLPKFAALVTLPILTGYLTKEEMGTYDLVTVLVSLILPSATLQIQTAAFRFLIDVRDDELQCRKIVTNIMVFIIPVSIAALAVLYMFLPGDRTLVKTLICLYFFADIIVNAERQISRGLNHNMEYSISAIVSAVGKMLFAMIFVWQLRLGLTGAVTALMSASILSAIVLSAAIRINELIDLSLVDKAVMRELIQYSWPMVPNSMSMWVMRVSDRFVVTLFMGVSANAVYSVANKIPSLLTLAQNTFTMAWQENASIVSKDDDAEAYYTQMFKTMFNIMAGFLGLLICATPLLFAILIRGDYGEAYFQMPILFLGMFFFSMCTFLGGIYVAYKDTKSVGITTVCAAISNLVIDLATIKWIGLYAASGSTLISYLFLMLFRMFDVRKIVRIKYDYRHMVFVLAVLIIECTLCFQQKMILNIVNTVFGAVMFWHLNKEFIRAVSRKGSAFLKKQLRR